MDFIQRLRMWVASERGASLVEYTLLVTFIAIAALTAIAFFGSELASDYSSIASSVP